MLRGGLAILMAVTAAAHGIGSGLKSSRNWEQPLPERPRVKISTNDKLLIPSIAEEARRSAFFDNDRRVKRREELWELQRRFSHA